MADQGGFYSKINILNPSVPRLAGSFDPGEYCAGGLVHGYFAFVYGTSTNSIYVLDIRDITTPTLLYTMQAALFLEISGNYAFVVDYYTGKFHVTDLVPGD